MDHREPIDQDRDIIAVVVSGTFLPADSILIDYLQEVVVDILLVDQRDILYAAIVTL